MTAHIRLPKTGFQSAARLCHLIVRLDSRWNAKIIAALVATIGSDPGWNTLVGIARTISNFREVEEK